MIKTVEAFFDGEVRRPGKPLELQPNTRARVFVDTSESKREAAIVSSHGAIGQFRTPFRLVGANRGIPLGTTVKLEI